jgi:hypothetical protein
MGTGIPREASAFKEPCRVMRRLRHIETLGSAIQVQPCSHPKDLYQERYPRRADHGLQVAESVRTSVHFRVPE